MKIVSWNCKSCARDSFLSQALYFVKLTGMDIFFLLDTRMNSNAAESLVKAFNFDCSEISPSHGQCGGIILLWNTKKLNINVIQVHDRFLHCRIHDHINHSSWHATFLYMTPQKENQCHIWNELLQLKPPNLDPWMIIGDFNCILSLHEKLGGAQRTTTYMTQFMNFLNNTALLSLPSLGNSFTWCNNHQIASRIYERLDKAVVNASWLHLYRLVVLNNLTILSSDHGPICLSLDQVVKKTNKKFMLKAMWLKHSDFINVVTKALDL